jgi:hypothetical protein
MDDAEYMHQVNFFLTSILMPKLHSTITLTLNEAVEIASTDNEASDGYSCVYTIKLMATAKSASATSVTISMPLITFLGGLKMQGQNQKAEYGGVRYKFVVRDSDSDTASSSSSSS